MARLVGAQLSTAMKQTVIIENHVGAGGSIGANLVAKAPPDGYTVLVDSMSGAINPVIATVPYDPVRDLLPVAQLVSQAFIVVANPKLPVKNLRDVARLAAPLLNFPQKPGEFAVDFHTVVLQTRQFQSAGLLHR